MKNTEFDMFSFFEMTPDLVCIASKDGFFKKVNKAVLATLEYSESELFNVPIKTFVHPDDKEQTAYTRAKLLEGDNLINFENRYSTKSGNYVWLQWTSIYIPDKEIVFAIAKNVTQRKKAELENQQKFKKFEGLATHFKTNLEKERKNFAHELHEEVAQLAAAIKLDIDIVKTSSSGLNDFFKERIENASNTLRLLINKIRKISFSLSPTMLEQFGLNETLDWLCKEFTSINNIPCSFRHHYLEKAITYEMKLDFFRICQEALSNVMRHARAKSVLISLDDVGDEICLTVTDDGVGFDKEKVVITPGFTNMNELASILNGKLQITSSLGNGTKVSFTIPRSYV